MRKVRDLMGELGFREDGSDEVKKAFIKNLIRSAYGVEVSSSKNPTLKSKDTAAQPGEQLSFQLDSIDPVEALFPKKKSS